MKFWDSSALVPLLVVEASTSQLQAFYDDDERVLVWWAAVVECTSALARRERAGAPADLIASGFERLRDLESRWQETGPAEVVRTTARRLARVHGLRAADSFQLAAALVACEEQPSTLELVTLDDRLALAASREGFTVVPGP